MSLVVILGFGLAAYSLYEELQMEANPEYRPLCDIQEGVSCSKAFKSEWGTGFGFIHKIVGEATGTFCDWQGSALGMG